MSKPNNPLAAKPADDPMKQWKTPTDARGLDRLGGMLMNQINHSLPRVLAGAGPRLVRALISEVQRNERLGDCTPLSLFGGMLAAGQLGLMIGGPAGEAYLLPFRNNKKNCSETTLVIGYKGYIALAHRSDRLARITPVRVREGDHFQYTRGMENKLVHHPVRDNERPVTDYYVVIENTNGGKDFEVMTVKEAMWHRDRFATSRQYKSGPWYDMEHGFHEMALKTCIRKFAKRMPLSAELVSAAALDEAGDEGVPQHLSSFLPPDIQPDDVAGTPEHLARKLEQADAPPAPPGQLFGNESETDLSALKR